MENIYEIVRIRQITEDLEGKRDDIRGPEDGVRFVKKVAGKDEREFFLVLCLNTKNHIVAVYRSYIEEFNCSVINSKEIFTSAILHNSASIIVAHHYSPDTVIPSSKDYEVTKMLAEAGKTLGIELLDNLIVNSGRFYSMKERGKL
ncbi:JAB domain-containing protein [Bacillus pseudomycoides]|uniref:JAB domain-containing protein n=1 Tax=Bacillus pseudomycoides TaxID=64104 RepID=UPI000BEB86B6|nr:JAB domain-containing protein [Bacillus pseudomycoides]PEB42241.1 DNA repair protein RadC [Bacillus pseudomycoides]PEM69331.1 DNA repair protein RadC [Bacillus pseudomycoides]PGA62200.1 DNA repair protein RadC [Bacillus pseudomycoides]